MLAFVRNDPETRPGQSSPSIDLNQEVSAFVDNAAQVCIITGFPGFTIALQLQRRAVGSGTYVVSILVSS